MDDALADLLRHDPAEGLRRLLADLAPLVKGALVHEFRRRAEHTIDEAISKAALIAAEKIDGYDQRKGTFSQWFYTIARNTALTALRREALWSTRSTVFEHIPAKDPVPPADPPPPLLKDLWLCIEELPRMQRLVLTADLRVGGSAEADTLAATLHTTANAVYVARSKGRAALRKLLRDLGHEL